MEVMEDEAPLLEQTSHNSPPKTELYRDYGSTEELLKCTAQWRKSGLRSTNSQIQLKIGPSEESEALPVSGGIPGTFFRKLKQHFIESHWPLSCIMALAFLGFYLPQKRKSKWSMTLLPFLVLLIGLGAHAYFILTSPHGDVYVGTKMMLSSLWVSSCVTYGLGLHHLRCHSQCWLNDLRKTQWRLVTLMLYLGVFVVSLVLFCDAHYQVIFDLVHIKDALLTNCTHIYCEPAFYLVAVSVYWGMYAAVTICCVFFGQCLSMCNTLTKGYATISRFTGDLPEALRMHAELRENVAGNIRNMRSWFTVHLLFNIIILLANVFVWWEATSVFTTPYEYLAQVAGTLVVVYKFFFPFISASYVTWHEFSLAQDLNDKVDYLREETFFSRMNLEMFLKQSKRRGYGFRLFKIQITFTIAIFSLIGSVFGLIYNMMRKY